MRNISIDSLIVATLLAYVALHVPEEALGRFPVFMAANWGIPDIGFARWLFHNICFFVPVLVAGLFVFNLDRKRFLPFGLGISLWGIVNFGEHLFFTIKNRSLAPGSFSACVFLILAIATLRALHSEKRLDRKTVLLSIVCALGYWAVPIGLILALAPAVGRMLA